MDGYIAKVERAQAHMDDLGQTVETFLKNHSHRVFTELDLEKGEAVALSAVLDQARERDWGVRVGDVLHNLRAALDHLAYQLGCLVHDPPTCKTEFPILWEPGKWESEGLRKIRCLDPQDISNIEEFQPYNPFFGIPDNPKSHPLWLLQDMDIDDKHKLINTTAITASFRELKVTTKDLEIVGRKEYPRGALERGAILARYKIRQTGPDPEIDVKAYGSFSAEFGKGTPAEGEGLFRTLYAIRGRVDNVLTTFATRFI